MVVFARAKINLGLHVQRRLPSGYHEIESVLLSVPWQDAVEVCLAEGSESSLTQYGPAALAGLPKEENLVWKAYQALAAHNPLPSLAFQVLKCVPAQAGLGGGSSNAVATLKAINAVCALGLAPATLHEIATTLGSDCPFFLHTTPMLATGTGTTLSPLQVELAGWWIVILHPGQGMSTQEAYQSITPRLRATHWQEVLSSPVEEWKQFLHNDFEAAVREKLPLVGRYLDALHTLGASHAALSGSGSAVYGLFRQEPRRAALPEAPYRFIGQL